MDERMSRSASLDLPQTNEISALEVAIAVFELPERRIRGACMKDVAHCAWISMVFVQRNDFVRDIPLWKPYMFSCLTKEEMLVCLKYDLQHRSDRLKRP
jgi:uncharacterized membrane protein (UPF0127 family)